MFRDIQVGLQEYDNKDIIFRAEPAKIASIVLSSNSLANTLEFVHYSGDYKSWAKDK